MSRALRQSGSALIAEQSSRTSFEVERIGAGASLVAVPMPERPSVAVAFMVAAGSRHESTEESGISHFFEHMVFKGGGRYPTPRAVSEAIEGVGGVLNAATDREATVFWTRVPAPELGRAIAVISDMLLRPVLAEEEVERERHVVIEELRMYQDNPQDQVQTLFDEVMFPDHPLGRDVAGSEETVGGFTGDDCRRHQRTRIRPDALTVSIAGGFSPEAARDLLLAETSPWITSDAAAPAPSAEPAPAPQGPRLRLVRRSVEQANVLIGGRAPSYLDPDRFALDLLNVVLGEGMSSRLFLELRERRGMVYDVHSFVTRFADTGVFGMGLGAESQRTPEAAQAAVAELRRLATDPVDEAELTKAREYAKGRLLLQLESTSALCEYAGQQQLLTGTILPPPAIVEHLDAVTAADIRRVAASVLDGGLRAAAVGPFRSERRLERALA